MAETDSKLSSRPSVALKELNEVLNQITATSPFSFVNLREGVKEKYVELI